MVRLKNNTMVKLGGLKLSQIDGRIKQIVEKWNNEGQLTESEYKYLNNAVIAYGEPRLTRDWDERARAAGPRGRINLEAFGARAEVIFSETRGRGVARRRAPSRRLARAAPEDGAKISHAVVG